MKRNNGVVLVHDETIWESKNWCDIMGIQIFVNFRKSEIYENLYCDDIHPNRTFPYGFIIYKHDLVVSFHQNISILKSQAFPFFLFS